MKRKDISGQKFGKLTVIKYAGANRTSAEWLCQCECGKSCVVVGNKLRSGHTQSCSCYQKVMASRGNFVHGMTRLPEYRTWQAMKERCYKENAASYIWYGQKGIKVCDRWLNSFENFIADMGLKPGPSFTIERRINTVNYSPSNCYWATKRQQGANTSRNRRIEYNGEVKILADWLRLFSVSNQYFYLLERRNGLDEAMSILSNRCQKLS